MGKVRTPKKWRCHAPATHRVMHQEESKSSKPDVAPLPEEIMKRDPIVLLDSGEKSDGQIQTKKKDKRRLRHEHWLQKIECCQMAREAAKAAEERRKTVIVGDMKPLADALPNLMEDTISSKEQTKRISPHQVNLVREVDRFKKVLLHPTYQKDPLVAISEHIRNSVLT